MEFATLTIGIMVPSIQDIQPVFVALIALQKRYKKLTFKFHLKHFQDKEQLILACKKLKVKGVTTEYDAESSCAFYVMPLNSPTTRTPVIYREEDGATIQQYPFAENTPEGWYEAIETMILYPELRQATYG